LAANIRGGGRIDHGTLIYEGVMLERKIILQHKKYWMGIPPPQVMPLMWALQTKHYMSHES
jgi:hypothetical protein